MCYFEGSLRVHPACNKVRLSLILWWCFSMYYFSTVFTRAITILLFANTWQKEKQPISSTKQCSLGSRQNSPCLNGEWFLLGGYCLFDRHCFPSLTKFLLISRFLRCRNLKTLQRLPVAARIVLNVKFGRLGYGFKGSFRRIRLDVYGTRTAESIVHMLSTINLSICLWTLSLLH